MKSRYDVILNFRKNYLNYLKHLNYLELSRVTLSTCNTQELLFYLGTFILTKLKFLLWCGWIIWLSAIIGSIKLTDLMCTFSQWVWNLFFSNSLKKIFVFRTSSAPSFKCIVYHSNVYEKPWPCHTFWITCKTDL